jgi:TPR repeat protein
MTLALCAALAFGAWTARDTWPVRRALAEAGHLNSQVVLARRLEAERPGPRDLVNAARYWRMAAQAGDVGAMKRIGTMYYRGDGVRKAPSLALGWLRRAGLAGDRDAQVLVAYCYHTGHGGPRDLPEARRWYARAAAQGDIGAMLALAYLYQGGDGHPQDPGVAIQWYGMAAERGSAAAQFHLGVIHEEGRGVPAEPLEAYKWYALAAEQRHQLAADGMAYLQEKLSKPQVLAAQRRVRDWKKRHHGAAVRVGPAGDVPGAPAA